MDALDRRQSGMLGQTRSRIIQIASRLFSERSYLGVSMADIAKRLDISKPALYHHFSSKMEIYAVVLDGVATELRARMAEAACADSPARRLHQVVRNYLEFGTEQRNLINALVVGLFPDDTELRQRIVSFREGLIEQVQPIVDESVGGRQSQAATDSYFLSELLLGMMDGLIVEHSFLRKPIDPERVAEQIVTFLGLRDEPAASS